jgi:crotonobetainyl-CoA:carnitine CoA-transferase CaiB-like acyl-CoA transferase
LSLPLEGLRVLELGVWVAGPTCARVLGEMGADVIKIENPKIGGDPVRWLIFPEVIPEPGVKYVSPTWEQCNTGKRSLAIDLTQPEGREVVYKLVKKSDVVVTNLRASAIDKLGMDYETLAKNNPKIIYAQNTGFGSNGPQRSRSAFDETAFWIRSGLMSVLGEPGTPPVILRGAMGDLTTALFMVAGIMTALYTRQLTGEGQKVDISLMASGMWVNGIVIHRRLMIGDSEVAQKDSRISPPNPLRNTYKSKDGKWFFFMMIDTERYWPQVIKAINRPDIEKDPRFDTHIKRMSKSKEIVSILDRIFATKTLAEWTPLFDGNDLVWEKETTVPEVVADPQAVQNGYVVEAINEEGKTQKFLGLPFQLSKTPILPRCGTPPLGEHNDDILKFLGYTKAQIAKLTDAKIVTKIVG